MSNVLWDLGRAEDAIEALDKAVTVEARVVWCS